MLIKQSQDKIKVWIWILTARVRFIQTALWVVVWREIQGRDAEPQEDSTSILGSGRQSQVPL